MIIMKISGEIRMIILTITAILILVLGVISAYSSSGNDHGGGSILVKINSYFMTLQEAISGEYLVDNGAVPFFNLTTQIFGNSHDFDNIYVSVDGVESSLNDAIEGSGLCGASVSLYGLEIIFGHSGNDINITIGGVDKSLQDAINDGDFCSDDCLTQIMDVGSGQTASFLAIANGLTQIVTCPSGYTGTPQRTCNLGVWGSLSGSCVLALECRYIWTTDFWGPARCGVHAAVGFKIHWDNSMMYSDCMSSFPELITEVDVAPYHYTRGLEMGSTVGGLTYEVCRILL